VRSIRSFHDPVAYICRQSKTGDCEAHHVEGTALSEVNDATPCGAMSVQPRHYMVLFIAFSFANQGELGYFLQNSKHLCIDHVHKKKANLRNTQTARSINPHSSSHNF